MRWIPSDQVSPISLSTLLADFRQGSTTPLFLGDGDVPEAAIIPFSSFARLILYDCEEADREEREFQEEVARRDRASDDTGALDMTLEDYVDSRDEPTRSRLRQVIAETDAADGYPQCMADGAPRYEVRLHPQLQADLLEMERQALAERDGPAGAQLVAAIAALRRMDGRVSPSKPFPHDPEVADLSDCDAAYFVGGADQ